MKLCIFVGVLDGVSQWLHNEQDSVSNHQPHECLLNRLFGRISKKTSKICVTGLCAGNSPATGEFPAQRTSNTENVSIWWRHHGLSGDGNRSRVQGLAALILCETADTLWNSISSHQHPLPYILKPWDRDKMGPITLTTHSNVLYWMNILDFRLKFHWSLFLGSN